MVPVESSECSELSDSGIKSVARNRWKVLARALHQEPEAPVIRDRSFYNVFTLILLQDRRNKYCEEWYSYSCSVASNVYSLKIRHMPQVFPLKKLIGFNNTGNICVWPSEEVLAYYCLCNQDLFVGKKVLELGGGMTCLAGLFVAKYVKCSQICVTDGNEASVSNVETIIENNDLKRDFIRCSVLKWNSQSNTPALKYDIIFCADCIFFDDSRMDLISTIWNSLESDGIALVVTPTRGAALPKFIDKAVSVGFQYSITKNYNPVVWQSHIQHSADPNYIESVRYPLLVVLSKRN